jgi:hypothetical protein
LSLELQRDYEWNVIEIINRISQGLLTDYHRAGLSLELQRDYEWNVIEIINKTP